MDYNTFYLHIENEISYLNKQICEAERNLKGNSLSVRMKSLLEDKDIVINKAFKELQVPLHQQEEFKDTLFTDDEFDHLCNAA